MAVTETRRLISARCSFMASTPKRLYTRVAERSPILHFPHLLCVVAFVSIDSDQCAARRRGETAIRTAIRVRVILKKPHAITSR